MQKTFEIYDFKGLTLNSYRNWHYQKSNKIKKEFTLAMSALKGYTFTPPLSVTYTVYKKHNRRFDLDNIVVIAKFFHDALVAHGCIQDDDAKTIREINFTFGGKADCDKIVVTIKELENGEVDTEGS